MTDQNNKIDTALAALAESVGSIVEADDGQAEALANTFHQFREYMTKGMTGDEASGLITEPKITGDRDGDAKVPTLSEVLALKPAAKERILAYMIACQKSHEEPDNMTPEQLETERLSKLRAVVKSHGITALAKGIIADGASGIDEAELVQLATEDAARAHPDLSPAQAFEKVYMADATLREAISIAKEAASLSPVVTDGVNPDDVQEATEALNRLVADQRARFPWKSAERAWDDAMRENPDLAERAIPRPEPVSIYSMPR